MDALFLGRLRVDSAGVLGPRLWGPAIKCRLLYVVIAKLVLRRRAVCAQSRKHK